MVEALASPDPAVRYAEAHRLATLDPPPADAIAALVQALGDRGFTVLEGHDSYGAYWEDRGYVSDEARHALMRMKTQAVPWLREALSSKACAYEASQVLEAFTTDEVRQLSEDDRTATVAALKDWDASLGSFAFEAELVRALERGQFSDDLCRLEFIAQHPNVDRRAEAMKRIGEQSDGRVAGILAGAIVHDASWKVQNAAVAALAVHPPTLSDASLGPLLQLLSDGNRSNTWPGIIEIASRYGPRAASVVPRLQAIVAGQGLPPMSDDYQKTVQEAAAQGLQALQG
ncbi:MAG TPA: hypothetical protein VGO93_09955 [Candidatus Xenobia bacterium]